MPDDGLVEVPAGHGAVAGGCAECRHIARGVDLVVAGAVIEGGRPTTEPEGRWVMQFVWTGPGVGAPAPGSVWNHR